MLMWSLLGLRLEVHPAPPQEVELRALRYLDPNVRKVMAQNPETAPKRPLL